jgi:hypothetical protein
MIEWKIEMSVTQDSPETEEELAELKKAEQEAQKEWEEHIWSIL